MNVILFVLVQQKNKTKQINREQTDS